jgi:hypothetical protein
LLGEDITVVVLAHLGALGDPLTYQQIRCISVDVLDHPTQRGTGHQQLAAEAVADPEGRACHLPSNRPDRTDPTLLLPCLNPPDAGHRSRQKKGASCTKSFTYMRRQREPSRAWQSRRENQRRLGRNVFFAQPSRCQVPAKGQTEPAVIRSVHPASQ